MQFITTLPQFTTSSKHKTCRADFFKKNYTPPQPPPNFSGILLNNYMNLRNFPPHFKFQQNSSIDGHPVES